MEQMTGTVRAICISREKGTEKRPIPEAHFIKDFGIEGDAHGGRWHRQVSLLSYDKVKAFNEKGAGVVDGDFGENLLVEGIDFKTLPVGTTFYGGDVILRMTQIGKECHSHCAIHARVGDCIMPREGVFAEVLQEGTLRPGDVLRAELPAADRPFTAAVITMSDKGAKGERKDESGPAAVEMLKAAGYDVVETMILPDEPAVLKTQLIRLADGRQVDLVLTSGGTGFSLRDRLFSQGPDAGGHHGCGGPERAGDRGVYPDALHGTDRPSYAEPRRVGDPEGDSDREPAGEPQGGAGELGLHLGCLGPWAEDPAG